MPVPFVNSVGNSSSGSGQTSLAATISGANVAAGDIVVVVVGSQTNLVASSVSDGTSAFNPGTPLNGIGMHLQIWYLEASVATGLPTYTVTWGGGGVSLPVMGVMVWRPSGTAALDVQDATGGGNSTTPTTGSITTTGTVELVVAANINSNGARTASSQTINSQAADNVLDVGSGSGSGLHMWSKEFAATFTSGAGTLTLSAGDSWLANIISFSITGGAPPSADDPIKRVDQSARIAESYPTGWKAQTWRKINPSLISVDQDGGGYTSRDISNMTVIQRLWRAVKWLAPQRRPGIPTDGPTPPPPSASPPLDGDNKRLRHKTRGHYH